MPARNPARVLALIDGEHYIPVIKDALDKVSEHDILLAAVFIGGSEKILDETDFSELKVPVITGDDPARLIAQAIDDYTADTVIDLSDEPVIGYVERLNFANVALSRGAHYRGADFCFSPPIFKNILYKPSMSIIGTGKRVGKTAVSAYICRVLEAQTSLKPCVVAMGRGGPREPDVLFGRDIRLDAAVLLEESRAGKHAASDYYEDALLSGITTIGCRRCGGGLAGMPYVSNVEDGARLANEVDAGFVIMEGSGAAIPPVDTTASLLVVGAGQPLEYIGGYFGPYRLMRSDMVVLTMCEEPVADEVKIDRLVREIAKSNPQAKVIRTIFRPKPVEDIAGADVFVTTTIDPRMMNKLATYLQDEYGCRVVGISPNLSNRRLLREDIQNAASHDVLLTEIKAAAIDVVAAVGLSKGKRVVFMDNEPIAVEKDLSFDEQIVAFTDRIVKQYDQER